MSMEPRKFTSPPIPPRIRPDDLTSYKRYYEWHEQYGEEWARSKNLFENTRKANELVDSVASLAFTAEAREACSERIVRDMFERNELGKEHESLMQYEQYARGFLEGFRSAATKPTVDE